VGIFYDLGYLLDRTFGSTIGSSKAMQLIFAGSSSEDSYSCGNLLDLYDDEDANRRKRYCRKKGCDEDR
jgi:hypothetical protein